ncbi:hypothetical protein J7T55_009348 [Diaporthe amygdali]|uniref:uncharacterized protein n=1 Tax=Phomopsis amygdali TaxID=1214568 RepID=UPI0022FEF697|nr:uncharacterized protein J7T55_009348 [Diaporthe amygdali]KAJ0107384.1 hypothetical protein J7T55_009348 [Diaporthe amygdali]
MFGHFASEAQSRSQAPSDDNGQVYPEDDLNPSTPPQPGTHSQHHRPWHTSNSTLITDDSFTSGQQAESHRQRTASMDVLTHKLSNSHLRLGDSVPPPLYRYPTSACSSVTSLDQPTDPRMEMDPCCQKLSSYVPSLLAATSSTSSAAEPDHPRHSHNFKQDVRRLRRQPSSLFLNESGGNSAIQTRVEGMISTGTQCNVYTPPLVPVAPIEADDNDGLDYGVGATGLEIDEGAGDDDESGIPFLDKLLSSRRASGTVGIRKNGFPLYRSSTDTALRCQNLVRNKPRMRRRKARQKPPSPTMSAGEASSGA